jgi:hypothetical protein
MSKEISTLEGDWPDDMSDMEKAKKLLRTARSNILAVMFPQRAIKSQVWHQAQAFAQTTDALAVLDNMDGEQINCCAGCIHTRETCPATPEDVVAGPMCRAGKPAYDDCDCCLPPVEEPEKEGEE